ncbi:hypothetical protein N665_0028s0005, partial [Sinapis alba]
IPLWEDFIVGKFLDISPHVAKVHMVLNKIWKYGDVSTNVDVYEVNATTMRFRVSSLKAREIFLKRGMWNIADVPMIVTKWTPRSEEEKQEEEAVPMWVHLHGVPLHMYSWKGLSFITSAVGSPVKLHQETIACSNLAVAKVFANFDVSKEFVVDFHFPWLPSRCKLCDKWGHTDEVCMIKEGQDGAMEVQAVQFGDIQESEMKDKAAQLTKNQKQSMVKQWLGNKDMKFGCILETRVKEKKADKILGSVFGDWSSMTNYEHSQGGIIWLLWRDIVRMTQVYNMGQLITCSVGFTNTYSVFAPGGCSDHLRCRIQLQKASKKIKRPFKYVNAIGSLPNFLPMVKQYWESTEKLFVSTSAMFRFSKKLKNLNPLIRDLGREKLGNLTVRTIEAHSLLCEKQKFTLANPCLVAMKEEADAYEKWLHIAELEEDFLKQISKLHWLEVGDQNNRNFHNSIKSRQAQNTMREIKCRDRSTTSSHLEIKTEAEGFFMEVLNLV